MTRFERLKYLPVRWRIDSSSRVWIFIREVDIENYVYVYNRMTYRITEAVGERLVQRLKVEAWNTLGRRLR